MSLSEEDDLSDLKTLSQRQAAAAIGISPRTLARLTARGEGPPCLDLGFKRLRRYPEARSQTTTEARYDGWLKERASLFEKIEALEAARDVALTRANQAEKRLADMAKRDAAAAKQSEVDQRDSPEYVEAVQLREAKRQSGRP